MSEYVPLNEVDMRPSRVRRIIVRIIGIFLAVVAIIGLSYVILAFVFHAFDTVDEEIPDVGLSEQTVLSELATSDIPYPDLSSYEYVDTSNLLPRYEEVSIDNAMNDPATGQVYRDVLVNTTYRNSSINVSTVLSQRYTFDHETTSWQSGPIQIGPITVKPIKAISTSIIEDNFPRLLADFSPDLAAQFEGCSILVHSSLDESGGSAMVEMSRTSSTERVACTVLIGVAWDDDTGWRITLLSSSSVATSWLNASNGTTSYTEINCNEGDLVAITGTVEARNGRLYLSTPSQYRVSMSGRTWTVSQFELSSSLTLTTGSSATVYGTISQGGSSSSAPLMIAVENII